LRPYVYVEPELFVEIKCQWNVENTPINPAIRQVVNNRSGQRETKAMTLSGDGYRYRFGRSRNARVLIASRVKSHEVCSNFDGCPQVNNARRAKDENLPTRWSKRAPGFGFARSHFADFGVIDVVRSAQSRRECFGPGYHGHRKRSRANEGSAVKSAPEEVQHPELDVNG